MQTLPSRQQALLPAWRLRGPADTPQGLHSAGQLPGTPGAEPGQAGRGLALAPSPLTST